MYEIPAAPFAFEFDPAQAALVVIDMQRDFLEPGGFGETLGNDPAPVREIVPTVAALIALFRKRGWLVVHTREDHLPDLSDCPPAKRERGKPSLRIGDPGPTGGFSCAASPARRSCRNLRPWRGKS
jgi:nicotinamidase-related amidase